MLAGCAAPAQMSKPGAGESEALDSIDPLEPMNRAVFEFNEAVDTVVLLPLARLYRFAVPRPVREAFRNFLRNLGAPLVLANDVLQGEGERAGVTMGRFLLNTTVGVVGLFDVAKDMGMPHHAEDFGQTLGVWGAEGGPYLVLPLLGPSTLRDGVGKVGDYFMNPLHYAEGADADAILLGLRAGEAVDTREGLIEPIEKLKKDPLALDYYVLIRSVFLQSRQNAIANKE